jgi:hypothetical protein
MAMVRQPKEIKIGPVDFESPIEKGDTPVRRSEGGPPCGDDMHSLSKQTFPKEKMRGPFVLSGEAYRRWKNIEIRERLLMWERYWARLTAKSSRTI